MILSIIPIYQSDDSVKSHTFLLFLPRFTHLFAVLSQKIPRTLFSVFFSPIRRLGISSRQRCTASHKERQWFEKAPARDGRALSGLSCFSIFSSPFFEITIDFFEVLAYNKYRISAAAHGRYVELRYYLLRPPRMGAMLS